MLLAMFLISDRDSTNWFSKLVTFSREDVLVEGFEEDQLRATSSGGS